MQYQHSGIVPHHSRAEIAQEAFPAEVRADLHQFVREENKDTLIDGFKRPSILLLK